MNFIASILKVVGLLCLINGALAATHPNHLCTQDENVIGFFNGVWNSQEDAFQSLRLLERTMTLEEHQQVQSSVTKFELFYNHTGTVTNATAFQDLAEVFIQRANEISPNYGDNFELFWSTVTGGADGYFEAVENLLFSQELGPRNTLSAANALILGLYSDLYTDISTGALGMLSEMVSNPPTASDYQRHSTRIKTLALEGKKLLLVAHSQGNLFVNAAYDAALSLEHYSADNIGVVHIAPASSITNGPHVLADIDLVINGLRAFGLATVPPITIALPFEHLRADPSGHTFVGTYLNSALASFNQTRELVMSELTRLEVPSIIQAEQGAFTVTLTWDGAGDIDLHTFEPSGQHVYYVEPDGISGFLDVDNTVGHGPEHYFASCDPDQLHTGQYKIGINNFDQTEGRTATVQVSTPYVADLATKSITMGPSLGVLGNTSPELVVSVDIAKDENGYFTIGLR